MKEQVSTPVGHWTGVCSVDDLFINVGARALVKDRQIAIFRLPDGQLFALDALDPFSEAAVLSRGIVGDIGGEPVVASPIYKQHFSLRSGRCLEDEGVSVATYPVRSNAGTVEVDVDGAD